MYQLICTVTKDRSIETAPIISWMINGTLPISSENGITLRKTVLTNDSTSTSVIVFNTLAVMHEGDYVCSAALGGTILSYTYLVVVQSK